MDSVSKADFDQLQGVWSQTYLEADGIVEPPNDEHTAAGSRVYFERNEFRVVKPDDTLLLMGTFELDATTSPKSITSVELDWR